MHVSHFAVHAGNTTRGGLGQWLGKSEKIQLLLRGQDYAEVDAVTDRTKWEHARRARRAAFGSTRVPPSAAAVAQGAPALRFVPRAPAPAASAFSRFVSERQRVWGRWAEAGAGLGARGREDADAREGTEGFVCAAALLVILGHRRRRAGRRHPNAAAAAAVVRAA